MLERDNIQKTEFLKALSDMWKDFDSRVLRYKVLPPLCAELRNMVMQSMILPMVFTIAESQDKLDFELATLPALLPVLSSASGETLLLLVKHAELIINKASQKHLILHLLPVLVRAYDDTDTRIQEEVLRRTIPLARQLDSQLVKQAILPRVHGLALKTTVAAVRVNALRCLGDLVSSLDKHAVLDILQTLQRCTAVDHSAPTLMCTLGVANAIFKQYGVEFAAEHVLPLLFPLLTAQQLSVQQFAKYILFVKDILRKIEEKRGVTVTDGGIPEVKVSPALANGLHSEPIHKPSLPISNSKSSPAWDEDWGPISRETSDPSSLHLNQQVKQPIIVSQPALSSATPMPSSTSTLNQPSRTLDDIQWPPPIASTAFTAQVSVNENQNQNQNQNSGVHPSSSFDDLDPFANWPPRPSNSASSVTGFATKSAYSYGSSGPNMSSLGFIDTSNPIGLSKPPQGSSSSNTSIGSSQSLLGMGNSNSSLGMGYSNTSSNGKRTGDLGSIFASANSGQPTPRIAPPPTTAIGRGTTAMGRGINAIGRGRGRNQGNAALAQASRSEQPPILDLL
ncbi:SCY1-like protein 2 isoform X2 [Iris pallida]|uniref:SCY1-like protein 2 isoform X2 n=1 Tax=Iris pallida TaxID=29817 RepID=A0AAX6ESQ6_IRIPA|nr:SCY1-like protein 2 isoform X2 [Iris pallida]